MILQTTIHYVLIIYDTKFKIDCLPQSLLKIDKKTKPKRKKSEINAERNWKETIENRSMKRKYNCKKRVPTRPLFHKWSRYVKSWEESTLALQRYDIKESIFQQINRNTPKIYTRDPPDFHNIFISFSQLSAITLFWCIICLMSRQHVSIHRLHLFLLHQTHQ